MASFPHSHPSPCVCGQAGSCRCKGCLVVSDKDARDLKVWVTPHQKLSAKGKGKGGIPQIEVYPLPEGYTSKGKGKGYTSNRS